MKQFEIITGDILKSNANAVVTISETILPGGTNIGELISQTARVAVTDKSCELGQAVLLSGGQMSTNYIIFSSGPSWKGGNRGEPSVLASCYISALNLAEKEGIKTVDIPSLPTGTYDSQLFQCASIAVRTIVESLRKSTMLDHIRIVCQDEKTTVVYKQAYNFWFADKKYARLMDDGWG